MCIQSQSVYCVMNNYDNSQTQSPKKETIKSTKPGRFRSLLTNLFSLSKIYLLWILIHYLAAYAYPIFCAPPTLIGFISSPFLASSPHCEAIRWCMTQGAINIKSMWIVLGTWFIAKLTI